MRHVTSATPVALGGALVIPAGLLAKLRDEPLQDESGFGAGYPRRTKPDRTPGNEYVRAVEEAQGCYVQDVSAQKCGWDLTSYPLPMDGKQSEARHIEVKGRIKGAATITITRNEMLYALNQSDKFILALVLIAEDDSIEGPYYLKNPFTAEPGSGSVISQL